MNALTLFALLSVLLVIAPLRAAASDSVPITIRGKTLTLAFYRPANGGTPRGTVFMGSGDVGWVGLGVELAGFLSQEGYAVVGINVRQYLASYTSSQSHLSTGQIAGDYAAIAQLMRDRHTLWEPVVVAGVSEGAALAVLAGADRANHTWVKGVITMGLPPTAELAWRWTDISAWITKHNSGEPSFEPKAFIAGIAPLPLWMLQSRHDEYVTEADYRAFEGAARPPARLIVIDASNHRFTDRRPELKTQFLAGLAWIRKPA